LGTRRGRLALPGFFLFEKDAATFHAGRYLDQCFFVRDRRFKITLPQLSLKP
jgi:hypothetical protein